MPPNPQGAAKPPVILRRRTPVLSRTSPKVVSNRVASLIKERPGATGPRKGTSCSPENTGTRQTVKPGIVPRRLACCPPISTTPRRPLQWAPPRLTSPIMRTVARSRQTGLSMSAPSCDRLRSHRRRPTLKRSCLATSRRSPAWILGIDLCSSADSQGVEEQVARPGRHLADWV